MFFIKFIKKNLNIGLFVCIALVALFAPAVVRADFSAGAPCPMKKQEIEKADTGKSVTTASCQKFNDCAIGCTSFMSTEECGGELDCCICFSGSEPVNLSGSEYPNPLGAGVGIFDVMGRVVKVFLGIIGALALLIFIYGGVSYMTAGGEESRVTKARDVLKYATIGLVAIMLAYAVVNFFISALVGT